VDFEAFESKVVEFQVKVLQVGDTEKYSVEFRKIKGDKLIYNHVIKRLLDDLAYMVNVSA
jgi:hypothetical protein